MDKNKPVVLCVDDEDVNLRLIEAMLIPRGYEVIAASSGKEAIEKLKSQKVDLVLLDIMMPGMDGYEVCSALRSVPATEHIPVVMVTSLSDRGSKLKGLEAGANDFLTKPVDCTELLVRTKNILKVKEFEDFLKNYNETLEAEINKKTSELKTALDELRKSQGQVKEGCLDTIYRLTVVAEHKDEDTSSHIKRVGFYCSHIAGELGFSEADAEIIFYASPMHDIGKVGIPSDILLKPSRLSEEEFALMKTHTTMGGRILGNSSSPFINMAEKIALTHHERWDGGGYPKGLKRGEIPIEGRIMNLADQYDSLRSRRPYKPPFDHEKTFKVITEGDGRTMPGHFDPEVLNVFRDIHKRFQEIYEAHKD